VVEEGGMLVEVVGGGGLVVEEVTGLGFGFGFGNETGLSCRGLPEELTGVLGGLKLEGLFDTGSLGVF